MKRYQPVINWYGSSPGAGMQENERGQYYHKDDADKRNAEAERIMRAELLTDTGQGISQWYCLVCGNHGEDGAGPESIKHGDCALARWLGLSD